MNALAAKGFDIAPFALPDCPPGEVWFEEPRDIQRLIVTFAGKPPAEAKLQYLRKAWPKDRIERSADADLVRPSMFGWMRIDDWFDTTWCDSAVNVRRAGPRELAFTFQGLLAEMRYFPDAEHYDVTFRRTLGVRVAGDAQVKRVQVFTRSAARRSRLRVELDAGRKTPGRRIEPGGYNAVVRKLTGRAGTTVRGTTVELRPAPIRRVTVNGRDHAAFAAATGDVDITGMAGTLRIEARF